MNVKLEPFITDPDVPRAVYSSSPHLPFLCVCVMIVMMLMIGTAVEKQQSHPPYPLVILLQVTGEGNAGWKFLFRTWQVLQRREALRNDKYILKGSYYNVGSRICSYMYHCWEKQL
jgi:hypothetical protein